MGTLSQVNNVQTQKMATGVWFDTHPISWRLVQTKKNYYANIIQIIFWIFKFLS